MTSRYPGGLVRKNAANTAIAGASGVWDLGSQAQAVRNNTWPISGLANPVSGSLRFRDTASPPKSLFSNSSLKLMRFRKFFFIQEHTVEETTNMSVIFFNGFVVQFSFSFDFIFC